MILEEEHNCFEPGQCKVLNFGKIMLPHERKFKLIVHKKAEDIVQIEMNGEISPVKFS